MKPKSETRLTDGFAAQFVARVAAFHEENKSIIKFCCGRFFEDLRGAINSQNFPGWIGKGEVAYSITLTNVIIPVNIPGKIRLCLEIHVEDAGNMFNDGDRVINPLIDIPPSLLTAYNAIASEAYIAELSSDNRRIERIKISEKIGDLNKRLEQIR